MLQTISDSVSQLRYKHDWLVYIKQTSEGLNEVLENWNNAPADFHFILRKVCVHEQGLLHFWRIHLLLLALQLFNFLISGNSALQMHAWKNVINDCIIFMMHAVST